MFFYCPPQKMLTVHYSHWGGLGNYLFHLACLLHACAKTGHRPVLLHAQMISLHAMGMDYYKTICARFQPMIDLNRKVAVLIEERQGFTYDEVLIEALQNAVRQHVRSRERHQADQQARERFAQLSAREREVLGLIVEGLTNKEIGRALELSPRTVETHRANLFAKLGAESLAQLIRRYAALVDAAS